jgi:hypothetical protein
MTHERLTQIVDAVPDMSWADVVILLAMYGCPVTSSDIVLELLEIYLFWAVNYSQYQAMQLVKDSQS